MVIALPFLFLNFKIVNIGLFYFIHFSALINMTLKYKDEGQLKAYLSSISIQSYPSPPSNSVRHSIFVFMLTMCDACMSNLDYMKSPH